MTALVDSSIFNKSKFINKIELWLPCIFGLVVFGFFLWFDPTPNKFKENGEVAEKVVGIAFLVSAVVGYVSYKRGCLNSKTVIVMLFICGFSLRLAYALQYGYSHNQHDVESLNSSGHLSYIFGLANNEGLPQTNDWQYCHPPLHHILAAISVKFSQALGFTDARSFENIQYLTVMYSTMTMFAGTAICRLCNIKGKILCICVAILAFHPTFFIFAGSINNDILMIMLSAYAVVFLLKWCKNHTVFNACVCGLFCGLAMMTKASAALMSVVAALTVIYVFFSEKCNNLLSFLLQAICFLLVFLPLGLWHPIRNYLLFEQPLGYVAPIPITNPLYTGDMNFVERFLSPFATLETDVYVDVWNEYNVWRYLLRNSLFGEYNFGNAGVAQLCVYANEVLIFGSIVSMVYVIFKKESYFAENVRLPLILSFFIHLGSFVYLNISAPFGCSMDFRYIVPLLFSGVAFWGIYLSTINRNGIVYKIALPTFGFSVLMLSVCSTVLLLGV